MAYLWVVVTRGNAIGILQSKEWRRRKMRRFMRSAFCVDLTFDYAECIKVFTLKELCTYIMDIYHRFQLTRWITSRWHNRNRGIAWVLQANTTAGTPSSPRLWVLSQVLCVLFAFVEAVLGCQLHRNILRLIISIKIINVYDDGSIFFKRDKRNRDKPSSK